MNTRQHSVFARQFLAAALVSLGVAFPAIADDIQPLSAYSYATNGLIGWWDGEFNSLDANGVPIHKSDATQWVSLVGGGTDGVFGPTNTLKFGEKSVTLRGSRIQTTLARLPTSYSGHCLTVQIVAKCIKSGSSFPDEMFSSWQGNLRINKAGSFVANEGTYTIANKNRKPYTLDPGIDLSMPQICTVAFLSDSMEINVNAKDMAVNTYSGTSGTMDPNQNFYIGSVRGRSDDKDPCHFEYYSVRVYDRKLDKDEIIRNAILDARRFGIDSLFAQPLALPITKDSYVQDGLYSQWDGVYNNLVDGKPTHVASPTQWDDLKGNATSFETAGKGVQKNGQDTKTPCYEYKDNRVVVRQNQVRVVVPMIPGDYHPWTMECAAFCSEEHQNNSIDSMFASSKYGNLGWRKDSGVFHISGTALGSNTKRGDGTGPNASDYPVASKRTYSYSFANYSATLALDGTRVSYTVNTGSGDAPDNGEFAVGSSRGKTDATTPCAFDYYSVRIYDRPLTTAEQRQNHFVDSVRFFGAPVTTNLVVTGEPRCVGAVNPNYGSYCNVKEDDFVVCSAPTNAKSYRLLGYEVQTNGVNGTWHPWLSGTGSSFRFFQPALAVKVVWKWRSPGLAVIIQ